MPSTPRTPPPLRPVTPLGLIADGLSDIRAQLIADGAVNDHVIEKLDLALALASDLDPYLDQCTTPASKALALLDERTRNQEWKDFGSSISAPTLEAEMLSGHLEGQFLDFLVRISNAKRVLEVGMFTGYSALAMAEALPAEGVLLACEIDPEVADFAKRCFEESESGDKIEVRIGPAATTLHELSGSVEKFDLVFIDADKAGYRSYLDLIIDGDLLASGGTICVDNTLMQGQAFIEGSRTANGVAIAAFNDAVAADPRLRQVLLPIRDGVTLIRRVDD